MTVLTERSPVYELRRWDLSQLLEEPSESLIAERFTELESSVTSFESRRTSLRRPSRELQGHFSAACHYEAAATCGGARLR